ncbi:MAG TPA: Uma2 family endonuclease [Acidobacteriota bacterium]|nr:Uma2 family endonuclease [Acidobacteriota bacterium]
MRRAKVRFNYNDYLLLPEDKRYEILDGDLFVVAAPNIRHQQICGNLFDALLHHVRERDLGELLFAPCDVILSEEDVLQPDILFVRKNHASIIGKLNLRGAPDLIVEILSEGSRNRDLDLKRKLYARFGVQEYWIVDPDVASIEVLTWSEAGYVTAGSFGKSDRMSSPLLAELRIPLAEILA